MEKKSNLNTPVSSIEERQNEPLVGIFSCILQNRHQLWLRKTLWPPPLGHTNKEKILSRVFFTLQTYRAAN